MSVIGNIANLQLTDTFTITLLVQTFLINNTRSPDRAALTRIFHKLPRIKPS
ncbi:hypothetical protein [Endozoicomonas acroporae]|uniref:hypothetical protein n=1 Tax=Endozoicomonas acroporae TaxID=1701104 RepID=UPI0013D24583|nr:hypothetical protein [Endozoicomonas acroporae]